MQSVFNGDNLHELSNPVFWETMNLSSAELAQRVGKVNNDVYFNTLLILWTGLELEVNQNLFPF